MRGMTHQTDAAREAARETDGRFGAQPNTVPEIAINPSAPLGTFDIPVDELNAGDTFLIGGEPYLVHETWVLDIEPETRIAETDRGDIRLDREERVDIVRTGSEPNPEDADDFAGYCHRCGQAFARDQYQTTSHIHPRGGRDYNEDENHTPYSLDDAAEMI